MNWDTTKHQADSIFSSEPLTITGIKRIKVPFSSGTRDCYSIEVKEDVTYWKEIGGDKTAKKEIVTFQRTYKNRDQVSDDRNDAFYYFAYHFRSKNETKIPFKGYWFNKDFTGTAFCLSEEVNEVIKEEKKRWDNAKLTKEEDLKIENIEFVDAKWNALKKDINSSDWNPSLNEEEKKLVDEAKTTEEVREAQRKIALLREQKKQDNKQNNEIEELKKQLTEKTEQINKLKTELEGAKNQNQNNNNQQKITKLEDEIDELNLELNNLSKKNSRLTSDMGDKEKEIRELRDKIKELEKKQLEGGKKDDQKNTQLQAEIDTLKKQVEKIQQELEQSKKDKEKLGNDYQQEKEKREQTEAKLNDYKKEIEDLKKQIDTNKQSLSETEKALQAQIDQKQKELSELEKKIADLEKNEKDYQKQIEELKQKITGAKNEEKGNLQGQLTQKEKELDRAKQRLENYREQAKELRKDIDKLQDDFEAQRNKLSKELEELKDESEKLGTKVFELSAELANTQNERDGFKRELNSAKTQISQLQEQNKGVIAQLLKDLNARLDKFRVNLSIKKESDLKTKYGSNDYQEILDKSLTLNNLEQLENTIQAVICICATEIASQEVNSKKANPDEIHALLTHLNLIKTAWNQTASEISKENNPLYLEIIDRHSEYRQQVENLIEALQKQQSQTPVLEGLPAIKQQAKQDIEKVLTEASLSQEDIISDYQKYAEKIEQLTDSQEVKDFAQDMIAYIGRQKLAHQELKEALKNAAEVSSEDKDKEEGIFEKHRQARQKLDELSEKNSPEAKQAYQVMNKNNEVTNSINKLYGLIETYLAKYKEKGKERIEKIMEEDPSKKEFLQVLKEGTPRFDLYCTVWGIAERYIKDKLGKEVDVYPYVAVEGANGHTGWKADNWPTHYNKKFDFNINFNIINNTSLEKNFDKAEVMLLGTVAHELSHDKTVKEEVEGSLKEKKPQNHSGHFWQGFRHRSPSDKKETTVAYMCSCLSPEKRKELKDYIFDPSIPNHSQIRYLYFPNADYSAIRVPENERKKKWFSKDQGDIADVYEGTWTKLFEFVDSSLDKAGWTKEEIEKHWVKIWLKQPHEIKNKDEKDFKIYIYYKNDISENLRNLIDAEFSDKNEWEQETIHEDKIKKIADRVCANACEEGEFQQTAQIIHNPPGNPNK